MAFTSAQYKLIERYLISEGKKIALTGKRNPLTDNAALEVILLEAIEWEKTQPKPPVQAGAPYPGILKKGSKGKHVGILQRALIKAKIPLPLYEDDEDFGSETESGILAWKYREGFPTGLINGAVGETAWHALVNGKKLPASYAATKKQRIGTSSPNVGSNGKPGKIYSPSEWNSRGTVSGYVGQKVDLTGDYMIPHYGAIGEVSGPSTKAAEIALVRSFEYHHLYNNKWKGGLAYHYAVGKTGNIYQSMRGKNSWRGAHTGNAKNRPGDPNSNLGIVLLLGNKEKPTPAMLASVALLRKKYNIKSVRYHKEFDSTSCPGEVIPKYIK